MATSTHLQNLLGANPDRGASPEQGGRNDQRVPGGHAAAPDPPAGGEV